MSVSNETLSVVSDPGVRRRNMPLIYTQRPSKVLLQHQDEVNSEDEEEWEGVDALSSHRRLSSSPSRSSSPAEMEETKTKKQKKNKDKDKSRKSSLFAWNKRKRSKSKLEDDSPRRLGQSLHLSGSYDDEGAAKLAELLMDPSKLRRPNLGEEREMERERKGEMRRELLAAPSAGLSRWASDSAVHMSGLGEVEREGQWLVRVVLSAGRGLAVRDRTGTSDPYVKFRCGQFKYRSNVVPRNLNPEWNEAFSFKTQSLMHHLKVKVYDHDYGSFDDFMGGGTVPLDSCIHGELHIVDVGLQDIHAKELSLGFIRLFLTITPWEDKEPLKPPGPQSICVWTSVLTIHLLEGSNLPAMDNNGFSDPYCKFKLGRQKVKSKVVAKSLNPQWKQQFDLPLCHGDSTTLHIEVWDRDLLQSDDFIGETSVELDTLTQDQTHDLTLPLDSQPHATIHLLLTITGTSVREEEEGDEEEGEGEGERRHLALGRVRTVTDLDTLQERYTFFKVLKISSLTDIGFLKVTVEHVDMLDKVYDLFVIVELGNSQARTHTVQKSVNPIWLKTFHFDINDLHNHLEVTLYSESKFVGMVKIPLLRLEPGASKGYVLKDKDCISRAKGVLYLKCDLSYHPVRAGIRTVRPRERKLMEKEVTFQRKVLMQNIKRITAQVQGLSAGITWIRDIYNWKTPWKTSIVFLVFILGCVFVELWMVPFLLTIGFLFQYVVVYRKGQHVWQKQAKSRGLSMDTPISEVEELLDSSDLEDELEAASSSVGKKNFRKKFRQIQEVLLIVQNELGVVADTGERINNLFDWKVPFLCWMAIIVLFGASLVVFFIPLRYVILIWGIIKFTKKLREPNHIPFNELWEFISCSPCNRQLMHYKELCMYSSRSRLPNPRKHSHPHV